MKHAPENKLASGTISIVAPSVTIDVQYCEHQSRNGKLIPDLSGLKLSMIQAADLKEQLAIEEKKLLEGRRRYAFAQIQDQIWEEEEAR